MPKTWEPIESVTITSPATQVTLGAGGTIPQNFDDLVLVVSGQSTGGGSEWYMWPNGDIASNDTLFSRTFVATNGSSALSGRQNPGNNGGYAASICWATNAGTNTSVVNLMSYSNTSMFKTYLINMNIIHGVGYATRQVTLYRSTAAITSLLFGLYSGQQFAVGTTFTLYGIQSANVAQGDGVAATGGDEVYFSGGFKYHVFRSSGSLVVSRGGSVDYLVVAGGGGGAGGGGAGGAGAGGAGGLLAGSTTLSAATHTITIGAGGAGGGNSAVRGSNGTATSAFSLSPVGGGGGGRDTDSTRDGASGGSGGGGGHSSGVAGLGGAGTAGQGNAGGSGAVASSQIRGGGGGGAGAAGQTASSNAGVGGSGVAWPTGSSTFYAGGGGGGAVSDATRANGGTGGGGRGGFNSSNPGTAGTANTGAGGGGGGYDASTVGNGGAGGSGIVIVRYAV